MNQLYRYDSQSNTIFPVERAGYSFIYASGFTTLIFALVGLSGLAIAGMIITFFICFFFRDPDRVISQKDGAVVAPADGRIASAGIIQNPPFIEGPCVKIGIFMSIFNAHINRVPYSGTIKKISYHPGIFFFADCEVASIRNECNAVFLESAKNQTLCFVQIAGRIARRIICRIQENEKVIRGQKFGLICFGSRVDLYLPSNTLIQVRVGDKVKAGSSIIGLMVCNKGN